MEFAIVLPLLLLLVFGIIEFGLAFNRMQAFQASAREAARLASVGVEVSVVEERAIEVLGGVAAEADVDVDVDVTDCANSEGFARVTVSLTAAAQPGYAITLPFVGVLSSPDHATTAAFRCEGRP